MSLIVALRRKLYGRGRAQTPIYGISITEEARHERTVNGHPGGESCWSTRLRDPVATNVRSFLDRAYRAPCHNPSCRVPGTCKFGATFGGAWQFNGLAARMDPGNRGV